MDRTRYNVYLSGVQEGEGNHCGVALVVKAGLWNAFSGQWDPTISGLSLPNFPMETKRHG